MGEDCRHCIIVNSNLHFPKNNDKLNLKPYTNVYI